MIKDADKILSTIAELRKDMEAGRQDPVKQEKMNDFLDKMEAKNAERQAETLAAEKKDAEMKDRLDGLEAQLALRASNPGKSNYKDSEEYKTLTAHCQGGSKWAAVSEETKATLRSDIDAQGGFLVPVEMDNVIIKKITEISAIRQIARVRSVAGKTLNLAVRKTKPTANYEGEGETGGDDNSTYGSEQIVPLRLTYSSAITIDLLMDSAFDMESEIFQDASEAFAEKEGLKFVLGTGSKEPQGFLGDTRVTDGFRESASSGVLAADDILLVTGDLKTGYNPSFVMNRRTLATLRTQKSTTGQYLWTPGINGIVSNTLAGVQYLIANDMPDIASNAFAVAYGDFARGYTITDRTGLAIIRDDIGLKKQAMVEFTMHRWNTGKVTLPEAITGIKIKA